MKLIFDQKYATIVHKHNISGMYKVVFNEEQEEEEALEDVLAST